jgi:multicomponent Na+:H+ antiporter subunit D
MHAFGKITLFFAAGAIFVASGKTRIDQLAGIGKRMPWTMSAFLIGTLSVLGLPPLCGMWSKWLLAEGMIAAHQWAFLGALIVSSLLSIAYLIPISVQAFFASEPDDASPHGEAPWACRIPLLISAAACLVLFWWPGIFAQLAGMVR